MAGQNEASQLQPKAFASPQRVCKYVATVVVALALGAAVLGSGAATSAIKTLASFRIMGTPEVDTRSILASSDQACSRGATCLEASTQGDYAERDKPWDTDCFCPQSRAGLSSRSAFFSRANPGRARLAASSTRFDIVHTQAQSARKATY
mmetsp:Transcript_7368/g.21705  ORF Transcript_7368/g.21705 Transcript_7368/m.21705 type:complete len:150 (-) Transcript_7368:450-899(-)